LGGMESEEIAKKKLSAGIKDPGMERFKFT